MSDSFFVQHLHGNAKLIDLVDDEWLKDTLEHDDFNLPIADLDDEVDETLHVPNRKEHKW